MIFILWAVRKNNIFIYFLKAFCHIGQVLVDSMSRNIQEVRYNNNPFNGNKCMGKQNSKHGNQIKHMDIS